MAFSLDKVKDKLITGARLAHDIAIIGAMSVVSAAINVIEATKIKHIIIILIMLNIGVWSFVIGGMMQFIQADGTIVPSNYREEGCAEVKLEGEYLRCEVRYRKEQEVKVFLGKE